MAAFVGKWKQDDFDIKTATEFIKTTGVPDDVAEEHFNVRIILDVRQDGDKWTMLYTTTTEPILSKSYEFTLGKVYECADLFGRKFKSLPVLESDTKLKETCTEWSEKPIDIVREVKGDKMTNTATCEGAEMIMTFSRI